MSKLNKKHLSEVTVQHTYTYSNAYMQLTVAVFNPLHTNLHLYMPKGHNRSLIFDMPSHKLYARKQVFYDRHPFVGPYYGHFILESKCFLHFFFRSSNIFLKIAAYFNWELTHNIT